MTTDRLFTPLRVGRMLLSHRLAMAPMTRLRNSDVPSQVPLPLVATHFAQRGIIPGTLLITDATNPYPAATGMVNTPGIWSAEQIAGWRAVVDAVHANKSHLVLQLWDVGRTGDPEVLKAHGKTLRGPSAVGYEGGYAVPREMDDGEIWECVRGFGVAAKNAVEAGMDAVELHVANGYLVEQFLHPVANRRTDGWGGSVENRARFAIEVVKAMAEAVGPDRVGVRLSPWNFHQGVGMEDPREQYLYLIRELKGMGLAYLHLIEKITGSGDNGPFVEAWGNASPVLVGGNLEVDEMKEMVEKRYADREVVAVVGRRWTSNPDLVYRVKNNIPLVDYDRSTFYVPKLEKGYNDWAFSKEFEQETGEKA